MSDEEEQHQKQPRQKAGLFSRLFRKSTAPGDSQTPPKIDSATDSAPDQPKVKAPPPCDQPTVPAPEAAPPTEQTPPATKEKAIKKKKGFFSSLREGLSRSSSRLTEGVSAIFTKRKLDDEMLESLEDLLISADLGVTNASAITAKLGRERFDKEISDSEVKEFLAEEIANLLADNEKPLTFSPETPQIILMIGVNGAGKTTTIGKLAHQFKNDGKKIMLAAGDTFRAAAIEQLAIWGERNQVPVVTKELGSDAAGLVYDAINHAKAEGVDILMIDTAGRLQNRRELMDELAKIIRVIKKQMPDAPHHTLLVLDATVGQNAISQTETFKEVAGVTGLIMTKLDGTARGGVLVALAEKFSLPVHYIGVGEQVEDLQPFNATAFARALVGTQEIKPSPTNHQT